MKNERLAKILQLIASEDIGSQEELVKRLNEQGMSVTQATVSRDIKDLRLTKVRTEKGGFRYVAGLSAASAEKSNEKALAAKQAGDNKLVKDHRFSIQDGVLLKYLGTDTDVKIPENVTEIAKNAFYRKTTPVTITIPATVKVLQPYALAECKSLEKLIIEPGITMLPSNFCNCCRNLKEVILPDGIVEIGERAFHACQLFHVDIPQSVKIIGGGAFWETPLPDISLPPEIEHIGHFAFNDTSITEIVIPKSCRYLGDVICSPEKLMTMVICSDIVMPEPSPYSTKQKDTFSTNFLFHSFLEEKDKQNPKATIYCGPSVKKRMPKCWSGKIRPLSEWSAKKEVASDNKETSDRIPIYKLADEAVRRLFLGVADPAEALDKRKFPKKSTIYVETDQGTIEVINRAYTDIKGLKNYFGDWIGGYDMYDAMDHYLSKEAVAARINIFDDGRTDAAYYAKPQIDRKAPLLIKEQVATRLLLLTTVVDKCLDNDVLKQVIASMPRKKDGSLMKNRVTRIASGNIVSHDAEVIEFTAKVDSEKSVTLSVGYRSFSGEELGVIENDFLSTHLSIMNWDLDSDKMQEAIRASKYPSRAKAIRELRKAYLSGHDEWVFEWKKRFNEDPVFKSLAISLVWLLRERDNTKYAFMVKEDGRCVSCDGTEVVIPDHFRIAVAYGPHLEDDELLKWREVFAKEGIEQLFMQLDETRFDPQSLEHTTSPKNDYNHYRTSDGDKIVTRYDGIDVFYGFLEECLNDGYEYQAFSYQVEQICFPNDTTYMWAPMENRYSSYPYEDLSSGETIHLGEMFLPAFHAEDSVFSRPINHFLFMMDKACLKDAIDKHDLSLLQARAKFLSAANIGECIELAEAEKVEDCIAWLANYRTNHEGSNPSDAIANNTQTVAGSSVMEKDEEEPYYAVEGEHYAFEGENTMAVTEDTVFSSFPKGTIIDLDDNSIEVVDHVVIGYFGNETDIILPPGITMIGNGAFLSSSLRSVVIPEGVTEIGESAFTYCKELTHVSLPNSLKKIGEDAFSDCAKLAHVFLPNFLKEIGDGVLNEIGKEAFNNCTALERIDLPEGLTVIGDYAFSGCTKLAHVSLPNSLKEIRDGAFSRCTALERIDLPEDVTIIGENAFSDCTGLTEVTLPNNLKEIGKFAFSECATLKRIALLKSKRIDLPGGVTKIGGYAFNNCTELMDVTLPNNLKEIGEFAFSECTALKRIDLPESLTVIGDSSFWGCTKLTHISLPNSLKNIGAWAFRECTALEQIDIPEGVTHIEESAFADCTALTHVSLPSSLEVIQDYLFSNTGLREIRLPNSCRIIRTGAFNECAELTKVTLHDDVEAIMSLAFKDCPKLKEIRVPISAAIAPDTFDDGCPVQLIEDNAVNDSIKGSSLPIEFFVTKTGTLTRYAGMNKAAVEVPAGVKRIGVIAFAHNEELQSVSIPEGVIEIADEAFSGCKALKEVTFRGSSCKKIGFSAFQGCVALQSVLLPEGVDSIGYAAFRDSGLISVSLPKSLRELGLCAFEGCKNLREVMFLGENVDTINYETFSKCKALETLAIPEGVKEIHSAFQESEQLKEIFLPTSIQKVFLDEKDAGEGTVFHVAAGSMAETWCEEHNRAYDNLSYKEALDNEKREQTYSDARVAMEEGNYSAAKEMFTLIPGFKDTDAQTRVCEERILEQEREKAYAQAQERMDGGDYAAAKEQFYALKGFKNSDDLMSICENKYREQQKTKTYESARALMEQGEYAAAKEQFLGLLGFKDSDELMLICDNKCREQKKTRIYMNAVELMDQEDYSAAKEVFLTIKGFRDSDELMLICESKQREQKIARTYAQAKELMDQGAYARAKGMFLTIAGYKNSEDFVLACEGKQREQENARKYARAKILMNQGDFAGAKEMFHAITEYKDSEELVLVCEGKHREQLKEMEFQRLVKMEFSTKTPEEWNNLAEKFEKLENNKDASFHADRCRRKAEEVRTQLEEQRITEQRTRERVEYRQKLLDERKQLELTLEQHKGLGSWFGKKAKIRKAALERLKEIENELNKLD